LNSTSRLLVFLALPLFAADQLTKWLVLQHILPGEEVPVIPGFLNLVQVHNTGAAFGMLRDNNAFFIVLASVALVVVAVLARRGAFECPLQRIGAVLLVPGILGNLADRISHGFVVDFIDVILPLYGHWPAFNVADSCICVAAGLFLISSVLPAAPGKNPTPP